MDQAEKLRALIGKHNTPKPIANTNLRVIAVTSGKGGVGKTNLSVNLAINLARANKRVIIIDADLGLANVELLLGVSPKYSFKDIISGSVSVADALTVGPEGIRFLSGGSGLTQLANITEAQMGILISGFNQLEGMADILLIDTGAGISKSVTNFLKASHEAIIVTTSDPTSVTDAYAIIKVMAEGGATPPKLQMIVNRVENSKEGEEAFIRLNRVCVRFLNVKLNNLGSVPYDKHLVRAVKSQEPVTMLYPNSESSRSIAAISKRLLNEPAVENAGFKQFLVRLVGFMKN